MSATGVAELSTAGKIIWEVMEEQLWSHIHLSWLCTPQILLLQNWSWCAKHDPFQTEPDICFERVVKFTLKLNFVLPDLIQNPNSAKKSLHMSWNQRVLVKDAQGQTVLKAFSSNFKRWRCSQCGPTEWSVMCRGSPSPIRANLRMSLLH